MYRPLESGQTFLVRYGAMTGDAMRALVKANPGSCVIPCHDPNDVRVLNTNPEPADRVAGWISEDC